MRKLKNRRPPGRPPARPPEPDPFPRSRLEISCLGWEKAAWVKAAQRAGMNLADWVTDRLNEAAERPEE